MEDVGARQFLPGVHGVAADDARVLAARQLLLRRRGKALIHCVRQLPISDQQRAKTRKMSYDKAHKDKEIKKSVSSNAINPYGTEFSTTRCLGCPLERSLQATLSRVLLGVRS